MIPRLMLAAALLLAATGCSSASDATQPVTVFAAASLRTALEEIAGEFEQAWPGVDVALNFAGSRDLLAQLTQGATADVLATADMATMTDAIAAGIVSATPHPFATNRLAVAVPAANPAGIESVSDLSDPGLQLVVCAPQVPCGAAARQLQRNVGAVWRPVSEESSVAGVMGKVVAGEADAGVVYTTDVAAAADSVTVVAVPDEVNVTTIYPIAEVAAPSAAAERFIEFVIGPRGQAILASAGFGAP